MGCEGRNVVVAPKNIGGSLVQTKRQLTPEEIEKDRAERMRMLEEALLLLRKAKFPVDFCTDDGKIKIITDKWEISHENEKLSFAIEGLDISKHFINVSTTLGNHSFPHIVTGWMKPPGVE